MELTRLIKSLRKIKKKFKKRQNPILNGKMALVEIPSATRQKNFNQALKKHSKNTSSHLYYDSKANIYVCKKY